ncbi:DEAD/DEAH box helicase [Ensifer sp. ENS06]|uniref:DEAD/DEAH box helicase n=1 Tax=Ensifer sp. ENS06 TaxID=2769276 RepID=UPI00178178F8|nr:DEAD/DEAH box helicase [Ensifer sp. ENS06]MBD9627552.1 DEAD/DEAH box helicase [Ensifer sp. ENS06]
MKYELPPDHGLSAQTQTTAKLLPRADNSPSITDIQYEALASGVYKGASILVSAPTSTGKTLIGWWAIASALEAGKRAVYLVSHRALAKQKFEEVESIFLKSYVNGDRSAIVCATGDGVEDCAGRRSNSPLDSRILVATYEKFLGCLSVGGPPTDLRDICFVCDELQLVGDKHRGQSTELLLTLLRQAGWYQFVALSAVLSEKDANSLASWLDLKLVRNPQREKSIRLECRLVDQVHHVSFGPRHEGNELTERKRNSLSLNEIIASLAAEPGRGPIIVFCMTVDQTYDLARAWALTQIGAQWLETAAADDIDNDLVALVAKRTAYHNAELTEEERRFVEDRIESGEISVVFATTTLAAGVNFPLGSAVFAAWERWDFGRRIRVPLEAAEFKNMAGRVGRMGQDAAEGLVILTAESSQKAVEARKLMSLNAEGDLGGGINPSDFETLTLQLFAGRLCRSREDAFTLIGSTLTASREIDRNRAGIAHWKDDLYQNIDRLIQNGCLLETRNEVVITTFGIAVARSGLKPDTALYFLDGLSRSAESLTAKLGGDNPSGSEDDLLFILCHAALRCPEFDQYKGKPSRFINWRIGRDGKTVPNHYGTRLNAELFDGPWNADAGAANGALLLAQWASGRPREEIDRTVQGVRLGTVQATARDVAWVLSGVAEVIQYVTSPTLAEESRPQQLRGDSVRNSHVRQLARGIRRQATRISVGLPTDVLWMTELDIQGRRRRLTRKQIIALRTQRVVRPIDLMDGGAVNDEKRRIALGSNSAANLARNAAIEWKRSNREHCKSIHLRRAAPHDLAEMVHALYQLRGDDLEGAFERALSSLTIQWEKLDAPNRQAFPDYRIKVEDYEPLIVELKSKRSDNDLVSLNLAMEVLSASELAGYRDHFCITVCSPGVEPSVPATIEGCGRLCVLEISDLVEALLRLAEGRLTRGALQNWITTPGIALAEDLPTH